MIAIQEQEFQLDFFQDYEESLERMESDGTINVGDLVELTFYPYAVGVVQEILYDDYSGELWYRVNIDNETETYEENELVSIEEELE